MEKSSALSSVERNQFEKSFRSDRGNASFQK